MQSKLEMRGKRVPVRATDAVELISSIFCKIGCTTDTARQVAEHLADASLCGVESHGLMRTLQYAEQFESRYLDPVATPVLRSGGRGASEVDGRGGIGIPAMQLAYGSAVERARQSGICALGVRDAGHTGRHGAFADAAAEDGFLSICIGGGNRQKWPQVAPYGGTKGMLPTNPWCVGIPGGDRGPVVMDFATSQVAGGWIYAARSAGALLPEGSIVDREGNPTRDPEDYFAGGAILPSGGHKGYALALVAELIGEAMLGPAITECNWLLIVLEATQFRSSGHLQSAAEEVLSELRNCPPAPGFEQVEIPGERERMHRETSAGVIEVPETTWQQINALADRLGAR